MFVNVRLLDTFKHTVTTVFPAACECNFFYSTGNCAEGTGQCECRPEFTPPDCSSCSFGYFGYPNCRPCECNLNGTDGYYCEAIGGQCPCKSNYAGVFCNECAEKFYNFPECLRKYLVQLWLLFLLLTNILQLVTATQPGRYLKNATWKVGIVSARATTGVALATSANMVITTTLIVHVSVDEQLVDRAVSNFTPFRLQLRQSRHDPWHLR